MLLLAALVASLPAQAQVPVSNPSPSASVTKERQGGSFGLGVAVGAPSGLAGKVWFNNNSAMQFNIGGDQGRLGDMVATVDYTFHWRPFNTEGDIYSVPLHFGGGVNLSSNLYELNGDVFVGPRLVAGVTVLLTELPIDLYVEVAPTIYVYESFTWSIDGQLGMRYYF
jgi:hypothetical protein